MTKGFDQPLGVPYAEMPRGNRLKLVKVDPAVYDMVSFHAGFKGLTLRQAAEQMMQLGHLSDKAGERYAMTPYRHISRGEPYKLLNISPRVYALLMSYVEKNHCGVRFATEYLIRQCMNAANAHNWYKTGPWP